MTARRGQPATHVVYDEALLTLTDWQRSWLVERLIQLDHELITGAGTGEPLGILQALAVSTPPPAPAPSWSTWTWTHSARQNGKTQPHPCDCPHCPTCRTDQP